VEADEDQIPNQRTFDDLMRLFVTPEIERRQAAGTAPTPLPLRAAQVLLYPDQRKPTVRLNDEVKAIVGSKLKDGIVKQKGAPVYWHEFADIAEVRLTDQDDPDCAHITMLLVGDHWAISFDFRYAKDKSSKHVDVARQFLRSAEEAFGRNDWAAFVDTLFSAAELAARAWLLLLPDPSFYKKGTHREIQRRYQRDGALNVDPVFIDALNKLSGWRDRVRYLSGELSVDAGEATALLETVAAMIEHAARHASSRRDAHDSDGSP
jgi:hypothetical protein